MGRYRGCCRGTTSKQSSRTTGVSPLQHSRSFKSMQTLMMTENFLKCSSDALFSHMLQVVFVPSLFSFSTDVFNTFPTLITHKLRCRLTEMVLLLSVILLVHCAPLSGGLSLRSYQNAYFEPSHPSYALSGLSSVATIHQCLCHCYNHPICSTVTYFAINQTCIRHLARLDQGQVRATATAASAAVYTFGNRTSGRKCHCTCSDVMPHLFRKSGCVGYQQLRRFSLIQISPYSIDKMKHSSRSGTQLPAVTAYSPFRATIPAHIGPLSPQKMQSTMT